MPKTTQTPKSSGAPRFARRRVIRSADVATYTLEELPIGSLTCEGIVLAKSVFDHTYVTPAGEFEVDAADQPISVFARCEEDIVDHTRNYLASERGVQL